MSPKTLSSGYLTNHRFQDKNVAIQKSANDSCPYCVSQSHFIGKYHLRTCKNTSKSQKKTSQDPTIASDPPGKFPRFSRKKKHLNVNFQVFPKISPMSRTSVHLGSRRSCLPATLPAAHAALEAGSPPGTSHLADGEMRP